MNYSQQAKKTIEAKNAAPEDDFDGFSPHEMNIILYSPFANECPVHICSRIDAVLFEQSPIFQIARHLIKAIHDNEGIKLTATGNLPPRIVKEIYTKKYITDPFIETGITKLDQETKWNILHSTKLVLKLSKFIRTYKGQLLLTTQTKKILTNGEYSEFFHIFFHTFTTKFNWAYNDVFEDEGIGQTGFLYLLYLINKFGVDFRELSFYSELYFKAFPIFKARESTFFAGDSDFVLATRFFERFAEWFGFVEIYRKQNRLTGSVRVRRTKLLAHLLT